MGPQEKVILTRVNERRKKSIPDNPIQYFELTPEGTNSMAMFTVLARPGQSTGPHSLHHGGDENLMVLSGNFEVQLDDRKEKLGPGDSLFIPKGQGHRVTNIGDVDGECVFVISPPEY